MNDVVASHFRMGKDAGESFLERIAGERITAITIMYNHVPFTGVDIINKFKAIECPYKVLERVNFTFNMTLKYNVNFPDEYLEFELSEKRLNAHSYFTGADVYEATRFITSHPLDKAMRQVIYDKVQEKYGDLLLIGNMHANSIKVQFASWNIQHELKTLQKHMLQRKIDSLNLY